MREDLESSSLSLEAITGTLMFSQKNWIACRRLYRSLCPVVIRDRARALGRQCERILVEMKEAPSEAKNQLGLIMLSVKDSIGVDVSCKDTRNFFCKEVRKSEILFLAWENVELHVLRDK